MYCPQGSSAPVPVAPGYVSVGSVNQRSNQTLCPQGFYCTLGIPKPCPPGTYGDVLGLSSSVCAGNCPDGKVLHTRITCVKVSSVLRMCACPGYSCNAGSVNATAEPCVPGHYCVAGIDRRWPAGSYTPSYYGADVASCLLCPAGRFSTVVGSDTVSSCAPCSPFENSTVGASLCWPGVLGVCQRA